MGERSGRGIMTFGKASGEVHYLKGRSFDNRPQSRGGPAGPQFFRHGFLSPFSLPLSSLPSSSSLPSLLSLKCPSPSVLSLSMDEGPSQAPLLAQSFLSCSSSAGIMAYTR